MSAPTQAECAKMTDRPHDDPLVEGLAALLAPSWFGEALSDGSYPLNNYPGQHIRFRYWARERAGKIIDLIKEAESRHHIDIDIT